MKLTPEQLGTIRADYVEDWERYQRTRLEPELWNNLCGDDLITIGTLLEHIEGVEQERKRARTSIEEGLGWLK